MKKIKSDELIRLVSKVFKTKEKYISLNSNHRNVKKWDSLNHLKLLIAIESKYKIKINAETSFKLMSIKEIINYIDKLNK